ncbi:hypothetical protein LP421_13125 [Rhizobium sp. RCAM05350]|nr:hypothetical protein LP421_13125 [Rhizobium sp. RCAM05350]
MWSSIFKISTAIALATLSMPVSSYAQGAAMTAEQSDPKSLGWMLGAPPPADKIIRFSDPDYFSFPKMRWTVCHFRQLMPTVGVSLRPWCAEAFGARDRRRRLTD